MNRANSNATWGDGSFNLAPRSWREDQESQIKIPENDDELKRNNSVENIRKIGQMLLNRMSNIDDEKAPQSFESHRRNSDSQSDLRKQNKTRSAHELRRNSDSVEDIGKARAMFNQLTRGGAAPAANNDNGRDFFTLRRSGTNNQSEAGKKGSSLRKSESGSILRPSKYSNHILDSCISTPHLDMHRNSRSQVKFSASPSVYHYQLR